MGAAVDVIQKTPGVISTAQINGVLGPKHKPDKDMLVKSAAESEKLRKKTPTLSPGVQEEHFAVYAGHSTGYFGTDHHMAGLPNVPKIFRLSGFPGV